MTYELFSRMRQLFLYNLYEFTKIKKGERKLSLSIILLAL